MKILLDSKLLKSFLGGPVSNDDNDQCNSSIL